MGKIVEAFKVRLTKRINPIALLHEHKDKAISTARDEAHRFAVGFVKKQLLMVNFVVGSISFVLGAITAHWLFN